MVLPFCRARSHSSRDQAWRSHQSPEKRQGPAFQRTSPCTSFFRQTKDTGWPFSKVTFARSGGRKRRRAVTADFATAEPSAAASEVFFCGVLRARSEERRVGKECR